MKKEKKPLNSIALLFFMIIAAAVLSYLIPSGSYARTEVNGRMVVDPDSFAFVEGQAVTPFDIFVAIPAGMTNGVSLVVAGFLIGGGMECIQVSDALNVGISRVIKKAGLTRGNLILVFLFYIFALMGGFLGFIEGSIPFIPIAISIAVGLGYDSIVGVAIAIVGAVSGFACGPTNPYTVGVCQSIAGLPMYSGIVFRVGCFLVIPALCLAYILCYARKIRRDPSKSVVAGVDVSDLAFDVDAFESQQFTAKHALILLALLAGIVCYVYGAINLGWNFNHLGAIFIMVGILSCVLSGLDANGTAETFVRGAAGMTSAAFIMGTAYGISWIFTKASVLDSIVYYLSKPLSGLPPVVSIIGILTVIMLIDVLFSSGSGKALVVMPLVLPITQIVGIEPQVAILAYQFGDAVTNLCTPLLGVLLLALGFGRVPFSKWERFILPLVAGLYISSCIVLVIAMSINYC